MAPPPRRVEARRPSLSHRNSRSRRDGEASMAWFLLIMFGVVAFLIAGNFIGEQEA
jgi:hypothetical protein